MSKDQPKKNGNKNNYYRSMSTNNYFRSFCGDLISNRQLHMENCKECFLRNEVERLKEINKDLCSRNGNLAQLKSDLTILVRHIDVHDGYKSCGFKQMTTGQKKLFCLSIREDYEEYSEEFFKNYREDK